MDGVRFLKNGFLCLDHKSELAVRGTTETVSGKSIVIDFVKCNEQDDGIECEEDEIVKEFLADKTLMFKSN